MYKCKGYPSFSTPKHVSSWCWRLLIGHQDNRMQGTSYKPAYRKPRTPTCTFLQSSSILIMFSCGHSSSLFESADSLSFSLACSLWRLLAAMS